MSEAIPEFKPNLERLKKLEQQASSVRIGGKGVPRRKKKIIHKASSTDDKKLQSTLKKLSVNGIQGIEEVNMFKDSGEVLHFVAPKVQASLASNVFAISGHAETKQLSEMLPTIIQQLGGGGNDMINFKNLAKTLANANISTDELKASAAAAAAAADDEDVPQLVENFDEASKNEAI